MENARSKAFNWVVYATVFLSGAVTMSLEMLIGRSLTPYLGGTIYTWGALIAVFLIGMTAGYLIGGRLADRFRNLFYVAGLFVAAAGLVALVPLASDEVINTILDHVEDMRLAALLA
ncbi:MAG: fused MFS/spermidine synthase, partial [Alphaproteobacteria bacterium]|nr:fused MFS/spermidine synthase [Alphaproteobacteria bacterium]